VTSTLSSRSEVETDCSRFRITPRHVSWRQSLLPRSTSLTLLNSHRNSSIGIVVRPRRSPSLSLSRSSLTLTHLKQPANSIQGVVESSTRLAEAFVTVRCLSPFPILLIAIPLTSSTPLQRYYQAQDLSPADRALSLQPLYAQTAKISWNGNPIGWNDVPGFAQAMPVSKTDVQAFDCHPISGASSSFSLPKRD
jgi:hypothetical protein